MHADARTPTKRSFTQFYEMCSVHIVNVASADVAAIYIRLTALYIPWRHHRSHGELTIQREPARAFPTGIWSAPMLSARLSMRGALTANDSKMGATFPVSSCTK